MRGDRSRFLNGAGSVAPRLLLYFYMACQARTRAGGGLAHERGAAAYPDRARRVSDLAPTVVKRGIGNLGPRLQPELDPWLEASRLLSRQPVEPTVGLRENDSDAWSLSSTGCCNLRRRGTRSDHHHAGKPRAGRDSARDDVLDTSSACRPSYYSLAPGSLFEDPHREGARLHSEHGQSSIAPCSG